MEKSENAIVVRGPIIYYPRASGNKFVDDFRGTTQSEIKNRGFLCSCTGTVFFSKASMRQHWKSQTHRVWLGEKRTKIIEDYANLEGETKRANIEAGHARQQI